MKKLNCPVQNYAWGRLGDKSIVSTLKSTTTSNLDLSLPYAELWMGTHKNGPAKLLDDDTYLSDYLKKNPNLLESHENGDIQFLLKVLSVNKALSIQCHPTKEQAEILRMKDPKNYPDNNHKPEMAIALSNFELLCGFRVAKEILENLSIVPELKDKLNKKDIEDLESDNAQINKKALKNLFIMVMEGDNLFNQTIINNSIERIRKKTHPTDVEKLFVRLDKEYPGGDVGVLVSLFLNYYTLSPGQSVFLGPNIPHAYLSGECVECMACSDNTIRAGLTPKFKDVKTLGENLIYEMSPPKYFIRDEKKKDEGIIRYAPDVEEFSIDFLTNKVKILENVKASSILIVIKGSAEIGGKNNLKIRSGDIIFVPASQENTPFSNVSSDFEAYRAYTPKR
ncbi:Mannose-6-phosphate isomerase [Strongyloides ratti]|uniref:mannose-6-phosphate isomerase n=1 Tax=Strongyloides ratti TaxID=34506 RepID=A0A090MZG1_STRRB|nr:Mannose-6-phosphate isomerase [Strongyloides ratti]CEF68874.1 Mannose-6-phosphate isomerase [Strongyloides ratti]